MKVTRETRQSIVDAAWAVAERLGKFGYAEIATEMKISLEQATRIVRGWDGDGALRRVQSGTGLRNLWVIAEGYVRPEIRPGRSPEENMWTAMRRLRAFTPTDLAALSNTVPVSVSPLQAQGYCRALLAAGYLRVTRKAVPGKKEAIYRLTRNTGPFPPMERRVRAVVDANTGEVLTIGARP